MFNFIYTETFFSHWLFIVWKKSQVEMGHLLIIFPLSEGLDDFVDYWANLVNLTLHYVSFLKETSWLLQNMWFLDSNWSESVLNSLTFNK